MKDKTELNAYAKKHKNESYVVGRLKGLGEMSPEESKYCLLDPATRNVEQIIVEDSEETSKLLEIFMGPSADDRKDYLLKHFDTLEVN